MSVRSALASAAGLCLLFGLAACGGEAGTEVGTAPDRLVLLSAETDTVEVGEVTDPPLAVRVEDSAGEPVEGVGVRFLLAGGSGTVLSPAVAVTNRQGIAEARFQGGSEIGTSLVRVDIPSVSRIGPVSVEMVTVPAGEVTLEKTGGDLQQAEVQSQLPVAFQLSVTTPDGVPAGGAKVAWDMVEGDDEARLAGDTTFTDSEGATQNLLTLGATEKEYVVQAFAVGGVETDTVRFRTLGLSEPPGPASVDEVIPTPLRAGQNATLAGDGFGIQPDDVEVSVEGVKAEVLSVNPDRVEFRVPDFSDRCLPARDVGVRATVQGEPGSGTMVRLLPLEEPLVLGVGEARRLERAEELDCLQLEAEGDSEFTLVAASASRTEGGFTPLRLLLQASSPVTEDMETAETGTFEIHDRTAPEIQTRDGHVRIRQNAADELERRDAGPVRQSAASLRDLQQAAAASEISSGDTLRFNFPVSRDLSVSCTDTTSRITGVVRELGQHGVFVEDVNVPETRFDANQWSQIRREFDEFTFPTTTEYFGQPSDLDGNGRVIFLFTPEVNRLTPRGGRGFLAGLFLPLDLADSGDPERDGVPVDDGICPASNEGEILYLPVADPGGEFSDAIRLDQAFRNARLTPAHEMQHLISAQRRVVQGDGDFSDIDDVWLDEGRSHLAEEVVGIRMMDRGLDDDLGFSEIEADRNQLELFNVFHLDNFARLDFFMQGPNLAPVLSVQDPGGAASLQMRGFAWSFLRWLANQEGGMDEADLFRNMSGGGSSHATGVANVEQAVGLSWDELLSDYYGALALDGLDTPGLPPRLAFRTWNLRAIFSGLNENPRSGQIFTRPFPLAVRPLAVESTALDFDLTSSTAVYLRLQTGRDDRLAAIRIASRSGGPVPPGASARLLVIRTR